MCIRRCARNPDCLCAKVFHDTRIGSDNS
jgi:hypothetical protein